MEASHSNLGETKECHLLKSDLFPLDLLIVLSALSRAFHHSLPRRVFFMAWPLYRQASPTFLLDRTYLYPTYSLLLHMGPLPNTSHFILKMEAGRPFEMLVSCCNTIWCHNPEDFNLNGSSWFVIFMISSFMVF
jgi:hypothetical protein